MMAETHHNDVTLSSKFAARRVQELSNERNRSGGRPVSASYTGMGKVNPDLPYDHGDQSDRETAKDSIQYSY